MFKDQPKGLIPAALANLGERFGFYTMMAILTLFLMSKFGLDETEAGQLYSIFYGSIYILALVGGLIADWIKNYKGTIMAGLLVMSFGYLLLSVPGIIKTQHIALGALLIIAFGNGLFKGNLQALVGQLYDNPKYESKRDSGFQVFYMFINLGAIFAPQAAKFVRNWIVGLNGYDYNATLPELCWQYKNGTMSQEILNGRFTELATEVSRGVTPDMTTFAQSYLDAFNTGFHYAFGVAIIMMLVSLVIFLINKNALPTPAPKVKAEKKVFTPEEKAELQKNAKEIQQRIFALLAVFGIVIFFWFSFHQNGLTLTYFAKDYTLLKLGDMSIAVEDFQSVNPFIVVALTPVVIWLFSSLGKRGKEPSTPKKIAIGMLIASAAFVVLALGSTGLPNLSEVKEMGGLPEAMKVTPLLLLAVYFILTVAELFISPLGISFVSKVAPKHLQGLAQGGWLGATAIGNYILVYGALMYQNISISLTWWVFAILCGVSMLVMLGMVKWLERVAR